MQWMKRVEEFFFEGSLDDHLLDKWNLGIFFAILAPHKRDLRVLYIQTLDYVVGPICIDETSDYYLDNRPLGSFNLSSFESLEEVGFSSWDTGHNPDDVWRFLAPGLRKFVWFLDDTSSETGPLMFRATEGAWILALAEMAIQKGVPLKDISVTFGTKVDHEAFEAEAELLDHVALALRLRGISFHYDAKNIPADVVKDLFFASDDGEDEESEEQTDIQIARLA